MLGGFLTRVIFCLVSHLFKLELVGFNVLFHLVESGQAFRSEILQLLNSLTNQSFFEQAVDEALMVFFLLEASEDLAFVNDFSLFFGVLTLSALNIFKVKQSPLNHEFLPANALI